MFKIENTSTDLQFKNTSPELSFENTTPDLEYEIKEYDEYYGIYKVLLEWYGTFGSFDGKTEFQTL